MDFRWSPKLDTEAFTGTGYWAASQDEVEQQKRAAAVIDWLVNGVPDSSEESDQRIGEYLARLRAILDAVVLATLSRPQPALCRTSPKQSFRLLRASARLSLGGATCVPPSPPPADPAASGPIYPASAPV